jgi:hypothetical protein
VWGSKRTTRLRFRGVVASLEREAVARANNAPPTKEFKKVHMQEFAA